MREKSRKSSSSLPKKIEIFPLSPCYDLCFYVLPKHGLFFVCNLNIENDLSIKHQHKHTNRQNFILFHPIIDHQKFIVFVEENCFDRRTKK